MSQGGQLDNEDCMRAELARLREENERLRGERGRLHDLIASARALIDPEANPGWEEAALGSLRTCDDVARERDQAREALGRAMEAVVDARRTLVIEGYYTDTDPQPPGVGRRLDDVLADPTGQAALAERRALEAFVAEVGRVSRRAASGLTDSEAFFAIHSALARLEEARKWMLCEDCRHKEHRPGQCQILSGGPQADPFDGERCRCDHCPATHPEQFGAGSVRCEQPASVHDAIRDGGRVYLSHRGGGVSWLEEARRG